MSDVNLVSWVEDGESPQVIVNEQGLLSTVPLLESQGLIDKVDKEAWGSICWRRGFFEGSREIREISLNQLSLPFEESLKNSKLNVKTG